MDRFITPELTIGDDNQPRPDVETDNFAESIHQPPTDALHGTTSTDSESSDPESMFVSNRPRSSRRGPKPPIQPSTVVVRSAHLDQMIAEAKQRAQGGRALGIMTEKLERNFKAFLPLHMDRFSPAILDRLLRTRTKKLPSETAAWVAARKLVKNMINWWKSGSNQLDCQAQKAANGGGDCPLIGEGTIADVLQLEILVVVCKTVGGSPEKHFLANAGLSELCQPPYPGGMWHFSAYTDSGKSYKWDTCLSCVSTCLPGTNINTINCVSPKDGSILPTHLSIEPKGKGKAATRAMAS